VVRLVLVVVAEAVGVAGGAAGPQTVLPTDMSRSLPPLLPRLVVVPRPHAVRPSLSRLSLLLLRLRPHPCLLRSPSLRLHPPLHPPPSGRVTWML